MIYAPNKRSGASMEPRIGGFLKGAILSFAMMNALLNIVSFDSNVDSFLLILSVLIGGFIYLSRWNGALWVAGAGIMTALLVVIYSPLDQAMMKFLEKGDPLRECPAVVVLSSSKINHGKAPLSYALRIIQGYETLRSGYAHRLIISKVDEKDENYRFVTRQMRDLGLNYPVESIGFTNNTHDEALGAAKLAKMRHWDRVILVTQHDHMRRAAAVFEKAGLKVIASPCPEDNYHWGDPQGFKERSNAFKGCLHEIVGYWVYQRRGWI